MYVIAGATGNTGGAIAKQLLAQGQKVRVLGRSEARLKSLAAAGAETFVCDQADEAALARAFQGSSAAYMLLPPDMTSPDYRGRQDRISDATAAAVRKTGLRHVVTLSSIGADKSSGTGPVMGLHRLEGALDRIEGLNVLHLRAGYFMENTLPQIGVIQQMGIIAGGLTPELKLPMIATRDIAAVASKRLLSLDFRGHSTRELLGQRDLSMAEAAAIIARAVGKTDLSYARLPDEQVRGALIQIGMSENVAGLMIEMIGALNSGHMAALEKRSAENTTATSYETFIAEEFLPRYRVRPGAARAAGSD